MRAPDGRPVQRRQGSAGLHLPAQRHLRPHAPGLLLGQRLAPGLAGRAGAQLQSAQGGDRPRHGGDHRDGELVRDRRRNGAGRPGRPGAHDHRGARGAGHRRGRTRRLRGRRRHRDPGFDRADARRRGDRGTATCSSSWTTTAGSGCSTSPAASVSTNRSTTPGCGPATRSRRPPTSTMRRCGATPPTASPGSRASGEKTAASLIGSYGDLAGILAEASRPGSRISGSVRAKLGAAIDYLAVAPTVVAVARDLDPRGRLRRAPPARRPRRPGSVRRPDRRARARQQRHQGPGQPRQPRRRRRVSRGRPPRAAARPGPGPTLWSPG